MSVIFDSLEAMVNLEQNSGKSLQDYTKRFQRTHTRGSIRMPKALLEIKSYTKYPMDHISRKMNKILENQVLKIETNQTIDQS